MTHSVTICYIYIHKEYLSYTVKGWPEIVFMEKFI